jgi:hypothetical protein
MVPGAQTVVGRGVRIVAGPRLGVAAALAAPRAADAVVRRVGGCATIRRLAPTSSSANRVDATTGRHGMRTKTGLVLIAAATVMAAACGADEEPVARGPYNAEVVTDLERMRAEPDVVAAGGEFDVVFPTGQTRGPGFVLERDTDAGWEWLWAASSEPDVPAVRVWTDDEFVDQELVWLDGPGIDGTDPHRIPVPDDAEVGRWRICTAPNTPAVCAEFEVAADGG